MKTLKLALLILLISPICSSQELEETKFVAKHHLGFHAGLSTGIGFSYKLIDRHFGLQITGLPTYQDGDVWSSTGLAITYRLNKDLSVERKFIPLIYLGAHHLYEFNNQGDYYYLNDIVTYTAKPQHRLNIAAGVGIEHSITHRLLFNLMAGYGLYINDRSSTMLSGEIGLHYQL